jgi:hypothetical protein
MKRSPWQTSCYMRIMNVRSNRFRPGRDGAPAHSRSRVQLVFRARSPLRSIRPATAQPRTIGSVTLTYGVGTLRAIRFYLRLGAVLLVACQPGAPAPAPARCGPSVPANAQHPITSRAGALTGEYELIQVRTQPVAGVVTRGLLHLAPLDSVARAGAAGGAARDLIGWFDPTAGERTGLPEAGSRDATTPGAVLTGDHLRLGQPGAGDSPVEHLTITAVAPEGFWGWWKAMEAWEVTVKTKPQRVLPDPAGYFCALRVRP